MKCQDFVSRVIKGRQIKIWMISKENQKIKIKILHE